MLEKDKDWETYLLSPSGVSSDAIGVVDLNNQEEIDEKLDKIERENPKYEANTVEALKEIELGKSTSITDIRAWLESLGD